MNALEFYLKNENIKRDVFNEKEIPYPQTDSEKNNILDMIEYDLSPENLSHDGERQATEVRNEAKFLNEAKSILNNI
jgi:hypothetical protein